MNIGLDNFENTFKIVSNQNYHEILSSALVCLTKTKQKLHLPENTF